MRRYAFILALAALAASYAIWPLTRSFDVAITNARILQGDRIGTDPVTVGIRADRIVYIGKPPRSAKHEIDGGGYVLAPGFLDTNVPGFIHEGRTSELKLLDGVTSYLSAHGGLPGDNLAAHGKTTVLNYATSVGLAGFRAQLDDPAFDLLGGLDAALRAGAYEISLSPEYDPQGTSVERVRAICEHFGPQGVPISFHARYSSAERELEGIEEAFECARAGAPVHLLHLSSTGATHHPREALEILRRADAMGLTMFFDFYPYTSWASSIQRSRFEGDWRARYGVDWDRVWLPGRSQPLDAATFEQLRRTRKHWSIAVDSIPRTTVDIFALETGAPIGSDSATGHAVHPRGAGSFAKFLNDYTGDGKIPLERALYRLSTLACERFAPYVPDLATRGRIEVGYVADLMLWDPLRIRDNATLAKPLQASSGVEAAIVNGVVVIENGRLTRDAKATGLWMRGRLSQKAR